MSYHRGERTGPREPPHRIKCVQSQPSSTTTHRSRRQRRISAKPSRLPERSGPAPRFTRETPKQPVEVGTRRWCRRTVSFSAMTRAVDRASSYPASGDVGNGHSPPRRRQGNGVRSMRYPVGRESRMGRSGHWIRWSFAAASLLLLFSAAIIPVRRVQAQATGIATSGPSAPGTSLREVLLQATLAQLPGPPATIGLDRITLAPAARIPSHTHPGPAFVTVESGTLTVRVGGQAVFAPAREPGTPAAATIPPVDRDFDLGPGDQIVFPPDVPLTFSNTSTGSTRFLATLIVPAGNQHPPAWSWLDGTPGPEALAGVTLRSLGTRLSTAWPPGPLAVTLDRLALGPGQAIPGLSGPLLLALETGQLTVAQGASDASAAATPGAHYELNPGTALFFPRGSKAIPRTSETGLLVLLRLSVLPATGAAVPAATPPAEAGQTRTPQPTHHPPKRRPRRAIAFRRGPRRS
jgi:mannose-6-phosphate isomerase-like protein (cupin superfamily)